MSELKTNNNTHIDTGGGTYVKGSVHSDGDTVLRDKNTYYTFHSVPHGNSPTIDLPSYLVAASELMLADSYRDAIDLLSRVPEVQRHDARFCLLRALSRLGREYPDKLSRDQLQLIETDLSRAAKAPETRLSALAVLGLIKHDAYLLIGLSSDPTFDEIVKQLEGHIAEIFKDDFLLITKIQSSPEARQGIGLVT